MQVRRTHRRYRVSFVALRTHRLLVGLLTVLAALVGFCYLFLMNRVASEGYAVTQLMGQHKELSIELERLDARMASIQSSEYVGELSKKKGFVVEESSTAFIRIPAAQYTAQSNEALQNLTVQ